jgi:hypothetical protein
LRAHAVAEAALVLHRPWNVDTHSPGRLSWRAFVEYSKQCRAGTYVAVGTEIRVGKLVGRGRYHWMTSLVTPIAPSKTDRAIVMQRRASNRELWNANPPVPNHDFPFDNGFGNKGLGNGDGDGAGDAEVGGRPEGATTSLNQAVVNELFAASTDLRVKGTATHDR